jgi:hypothetical protein
LAARDEIFLLDDIDHGMNDGSGKGIILMTR